MAKDLNEHNTDGKENKINDPSRGIIEKEGNNIISYYNIEYYLKHFNIEIIREYYDTVKEFNWSGELINRYLVRFIRNKKWLKVKGKVLLLNDEGTEVMYRSYDFLYYEKTDINGNQIEMAVITEYDFDSVYSLELEYNKKAKEVSISKDKFGNIILYLNENKDDIGYYPARYRKGGKKYYIPVNSEHLSAHEYVEALIQLIDRKNNSPKMIEYFELLLRDPRLERKLSEYLISMPKANDDTYYQNQKRKI